jgi:hypothetical protein
VLLLRGCSTGTFFHRKGAKKAKNAQEFKGKEAGFLATFAFFAPLR